MCRRHVRLCVHVCRHAWCVCTQVFMCVCVCGCSCHIHSMFAHRARACLCLQVWSRIPVCVEDQVMLQPPTPGSLSRGQFWLCLPTGQLWAVRGARVTQRPDLAGRPQAHGPQVLSTLPDDDESSGQTRQGQKLYRIPLPCVQQMTQAVLGPAQGKNPGYSDPPSGAGGCLQPQRAPGRLQGRPETSPYGPGPPHTPQADLTDCPQNPGSPVSPSNLSGCHQRMPTALRGPSKAEGVRLEHFWDSEGRRIVMEFIAGQDCPQIWFQNPRMASCTEHELWGPGGNLGPHEHREGAPTSTFPSASEETQGWG